MQLTLEQIEAGKSLKGGWTAKTLASWGVPWPPPKGWKEALLTGSAMPEAQIKEEVERTPEVMLDDLVITLISMGKGDIVTGIEGLTDYYGGRVPSPEEIAESQIGLRNDQGGNVPW